MTTDLPMRLLALEAAISDVLAEFECDHFDACGPSACEDCMNTGWLVGNETDDDLVTRLLGLRRWLSPLVHGDRS